MVLCCYSAIVPLPGCPVGISPINKGNKHIIIPMIKIPTFLEKTAIWLCIDWLNTFETSSIDSLMIFIKKESNCFSLYRSHRPRLLYLDQLPHTLHLDYCEWLQNALPVLVFSLSFPFLLPFLNKPLCFFL